MQTELPRGFEWRDLLPALATVVALIMACMCHAFFLWPWPVQVGFDEGFEAAVVERVIDGRWLPYVDGISHRGPFLYWTQAIFHLIAGRFEWTGTRLLAMAAAMTTTSATFLTGWAAGWPLAGAVAALSFVFITCGVWSPGAGTGVHGEPVAVAYLTLATFFCAYALNRERHERRRMALLAAGGALTAICALTKQTLALASMPLFAWVLLQERPVVASGARWRRVLTHSASIYVAGGIGLVLLLMLRYALAGEFGTLLYWSTGFNAKSYLGPWEGKMLKTVSGWFWGSAWAMTGLVLALLLLVRPLTFIEGRSFGSFRAALRRGAFDIGVAGTAIALLGSGAASMRFWDHYFMPALPFFGLVFGVILESTFRNGSKINRLAQGAALFIVCAMVVTHSTQRLLDLRAQRARGHWASHRPDPACAEIDRIAGPGRDAVFMWGTVGDLYITCQRRSASLFTYTTVVAGIIPPFWNPNPKYVAPGSREMLLRELNEGRPPVIIDHPISRGAAMMDIPMLAEFVNANYCTLPAVRDKRGRQLQLFARNDLEACQAPKKKRKKKR